MVTLCWNNTNDPFNDLDDPFLPGHKNFSTKLLDEHQSPSGLPHGFYIEKLMGCCRVLLCSCDIPLSLCGLCSCDLNLFSSLMKTITVSIMLYCGLRQNIWCEILDSSIFYQIASSDKARMLIVSRAFISCSVWVQLWDRLRVGRFWIISFDV